MPTPNGLLSPWPLPPVVTVDALPDTRATKPGWKPVEPKAMTAPSAVAPVTAVETPYKRKPVALGLGL